MRFVAATALFATVLVSPAVSQSVRNEELPLRPGGQDLPIRFENLSLEDGLSQSTVYSIAQDRTGFMWFGTQSGLNRYDGTRIEVFRPDPFDSTSVMTGFIWDIDPDEKGYLWLAYGGGSVGRFDPATGQSRNYRANGADSTALAPGAAYDVVPDGDYVWVLTDGPVPGVQRLDTRTGKVTRYGSGAWNGGPVPGLGQLLIDGEGQKIIFTRNGTFRFDPASSRFDRISDLSPILARFDPDEPEVVWGGSENGVVRLNLETGESRVYDVSAGPINGVIEATPDPTEKGIIWATTQEGLARVEKATGAYRVYRSNTGDPNSIVGNQAARVYADHSGIVWVTALGSGVSRFDPTAIGFDKEAEVRNSPNSMRGAAVWKINVQQSPVVWVAAAGSETSDPAWYLNRIDRSTGITQSWKTAAVNRAPLVVDQRGRVWWGTQPAPWAELSGGVFRYDEGRRTMVPVFNQANGSLPDDQIFEMVETRDGALWIGTNDGLVRVDGTTGARTLFRAEPDNPAALADGRIRYIFEDSRGDVWVSSFRALARIRLGIGPVERFEGRPETAAFLADRYPRYPIEDRAGRMWWVTQDGAGRSTVVRYDADTDRFTEYPHVPGDRTTWTGISASGVVVDPDQDDVLWFVSYGGGLSRLDVAAGTFRHFGPVDGLTNLDAYQPIFDDEGILWVPTNGGLFSFNRETGRFQRYGVEYGLQSLEFNGGSVAKSVSGEMFFGGVKGFNAFFPSQLRSNEVPPSVALTEFLLFNERVTPGPDSPLREGIADAKEIRLAHDQNAPTFRFAALHFKRPEANQVRYRLEPLQPEWIEAHDMHEASYTNLEPGEYTFRVIAANSDGVWNEEGASLKIVVLPPWWRTRWAYLLYVVAFGGAIFSVDRTQRARIARRQREEMQAQELEHAKEIETAYHQLQQTKEQLVQQEKLASLGSLTAGIAHEIKNPLNFVNNFAEVNAELADELEEAVNKGDVETARAVLADLRGNAQQIAKHGKRADSIVRSMMQHARGETTEREVVTVNDFLEEYVNLAWHGMRARDHGFTAEVVRRFAPDAGSVSVQPQEVGRVVLNLLNNSFHAVQEKAQFAGPTFSPAVTVTTRREAGHVEIRVSDNGNGIPANLREKIFEPFFTTKATGEGTGLGLSLSHEIVTQGHGGSLTVGEAPGGGAEFTIRLPVG